MLPVSAYDEGYSKFLDKKLTYYNEDTGYKAVIDARDEYITEVEGQKLLEKMKPITDHCNVLFITTDSNYSSSESWSHQYAQRRIDDEFGYNSNSVAYLIDNEYDTVWATGDVGDYITIGKSRSITGNVYKMSADERYYDAAVEAFKEINDVIEGRAIAEPMKYICNAFIALFVALLINYRIVASKSRVKRASDIEMVEGSIRQLQSGRINVDLVHSSRRYSPRSSGSSGGHSGGHGGGHHGGGGHGGSHSH